ncbi:MAG TPA: hypothetical protein VIK55_14250 [Paludibacter sp.]
MDQFYSDYVLIDSSGIDLLRNRFAIKHINYPDIQDIRIRNGYLLRNRFIPLIVGIALVAVSLKILSPAFMILNEVTNQSTNFHAYRLIAMMFSIFLSLIMIGGYFIIQSMKRSKIMSIKTGDGKFDIRIREFDNIDTFENLLSFLNEKAKCRIEMND